MRLRHWPKLINMPNYSMDLVPKISGAQYGTQSVAKVVHNRHVDRIVEVCFTYTCMYDANIVR